MKPNIEAIIWNAKSGVGVYTSATSAPKESDVMQIIRVFYNEAKQKHLTVYCSSTLIDHLFKIFEGQVFGQFKCENCQHTNTVERLFRKTAPGKYFYHDLEITLEVSFDPACKYVVCFYSPGHTGMIIEVVQGLNILGE